MPGPSSSQEIEFEYNIWQVPDAPPVAILRRVQEGIHLEVSEAFAAAPHRGLETGGILLGRRQEDRILVEDFEPVPSEHSFGPSYRLSDADRQMLQETLHWFRSGAQPGLSVLGFYRSHTLPDLALREDDEDLMRAHFEAAEDLVVLVRPSLMGTNPEDFSIRRCSRAVPATAPDSQVIAWPPPRPRLSPEPEPPARKRWLWYAAAIALGLLGGALGYLWLYPANGAIRPSLTIPAPPAAVAMPAPGQPAPVVEGEPTPPAPDIEGIRELLNRWSGALKRGDVDTAADCYAPVVTTYFARHDVTRAAVRQSIRRARARYGRLDVYRITSLGITPVGDGRAVATFRKQWKTSGRTRSAGAEEERLTLVRSQGAWKISSEQAESGFRGNE